MKIQLILIFLFSISIASALTISPSTLDIEQQIESTKAYSINVTNTLSFPIQNFTFGNLSLYGFEFPKIVLESGETKEIEFNVTPSSKLSENLKADVEFKFLADIPSEVTTYKINITEDGFTRRFIAIRSGDTIEWKNTDDIFHSVKTPYFDVSLNPNDTYSYTFNEVGEYTFYDKNWDVISTFNGLINVIPRTSEELVHNPNYDIIWNVNLDFVSKPTTLEISLIGEEFEVDATEETEGAIIIKNIGQEQADSIGISSNSNWIEPKENNFNLNKNQQKIVSYVINPKILDTEETNKTHKINITIKAPNTPEYTKEIEVFIPYSDVFTNTESPESIFAYLDKLCEESPGNPLCIFKFCYEHPNDIKCNQNATTNGSIYGNNVTVNWTADDVSEFIRAYSKLATDSSRNSNDLKIINELLEEQFPDLFRKLNETETQRQKDKESDESERTILLVLFFVAIISIGAIVGYFIMKKIQAKKNWVEDPFNYSRGVFD